MENNQLIITTSWDDGSVYDRKIVDLLKKYSIRGTFYIPKEFNYQPKDGEIIIRVPDGEVKKSGFVGARTTEIFKFNVENPFLMPTTINCYPFPFGSGGAKAKSRTFLSNISLALNLSLPVGSFLSWKNLAKFLFDKAQSEKGVFHLWGHSWEIEKNNMWKDLEDVLEYISNKDDAKYLINSEIIDFLKKKD